MQNKAGKDISVLVEKLYNQMMNYRNQMTSIDASLAFAEEYLRMKNAAFLEGMSSSTDLIDAELNSSRAYAPNASRRPTTSTCCWRNCSKPRASATNFRLTPAAPTHGRSCSIKSKKI